MKISEIPADAVEAAFARIRDAMKWATQDGMIPTELVDGVPVLYQDLEVAISAHQAAAPGGLIQIAREAAASTRPSSPWAKRVLAGHRDDDHEVRAALAALSTSSASVERATIEVLTIELAEALRPFAKCAERLDEGDSDETWATMRVQVGDYHRAGRAMARFLARSTT